MVALHAQTVAFIFALDFRAPARRVRSATRGCCILLLVQGWNSHLRLRVRRASIVPTLFREALLMLAYSVTVGLALAAARDARALPLGLIPFLDA